MYLEGSPYLDMTPLSEYEHHLIQLWFECGTVEQNAGGLTALSWPTINAWAERFFTESFIEFIEHPRQSRRHKLEYTPIVTTECTLNDWELLMIRKLSQEYASEYAQAADKDRKCPRSIVVEDVDEDAALANANAIEDAFKSLFAGGDTSA